MRHSYPAQAGERNDDSLFGALSDDDNGSDAVGARGANRQIILNLLAEVRRIQPTRPPYSLKKDIVLLLPGLFHRAMNQIHPTVRYSLGRRLRNYLHLRATVLLTIPAAALLRCPQMVSRPTEGEGLLLMLRRDPAVVM